MPSFDTHLFDLPPELLYEIFKRLDISSIDRVSQTCKFLKDQVTTFKDVHKDYISHLLKNVANPADYEADDDWYDDYSDDDHSYTGSEILDRWEAGSYGSNYDEDLDELINGPPEPGDETVEN